MRPRILFLHVGPPKTGTSALQALLRVASSPALVYPRAGQWTDGAHHLLVFALQGERRRGRYEIPPVDFLADALLPELAATRGDVLISSEHFEPQVSGAAFFERFGPFIERHFDKVSIVVVARRPLERAASLYNQDIKDPVVGETRAPDAYLLDEPDRFRLAPTIAKWAEFAPDPIVVNYHPAETFVRRFFSVIRHGDFPIARVGWQNRSMGGKALLTLAAANRLLAEAAAREAFFEGLRKDKAFGVWRGTSFPFTRRAVAQFERALAGDIESLLRDYGIDLRPTRETGSKRFSLDDEQIAEIRDHLSGLPGFPERREEIEQLFASFRRASAP